MTGETLERLNVFIDGYKADIAERDAIIKKQNQILLHIKAELEAAKQYNPFNLVLMAGSMENIANVVNGQTKPFIDEGCAGCCKVVDIAANLQKELDEAHGILASKDRVIVNLHKTIYDFKTIETRETDRLHKTIRDMDVTISDLMDNDRRINGFLDEYRVTVDNRDKTIEELHTKIWELERTLPANFWDVVAGRDATIRKQRTTIKELKDGNIEDLKERYDPDKKDIDRLKHVISARESSIDECEKIGRHNVNVLKEIINGLEAELSARKGDSEVLMKVVEIVKEDKMMCGFTLNAIADLLVDYLDAPEGPPETPIDEKVCVFCGCENPSVQVGSDWFCGMRCVHGQADVNKHLHNTDEPQEITVTFCYHDR